MDPADRITMIRQMIRFRDQLTAAERNGLRVKAEVRELIPLARGCYVSKQNWESLYGEGRQIAAALAHSDRAARRPVFSHYTAAALWGLPLFGFADTRIHEITPPAGMVRSSDRVLRHRGMLAETEISQLAGVLLTSPMRTLFDVARSAKGEVAVGCADAVLQRKFFEGGRGGIDAQEAWRDSALAHLETMRGQSGVNTARCALGFADGRAESVLESVGRLRFARAGIRTEIQSRVPGRHSHNYFVDFELPDHNAFAEADGEVKYFDAGMTRGKDPREVLREEKERENWIRGTTNKPIYRFGFRQLVTQHAFENHFAAFRIFGRPELRKHRSNLP